MEKYLVENIDELDEDYLIEMAKVSKQDTHLPYDLWLDNAGSSRNNTHNKPRLKIKIDNQLIPILIDKYEPNIPDSVNKQFVYKIKQLDIIKEYIINNYETLIDYWNEKITDKQVLNRLGDYNEISNFNKMINYILSIKIKYAIQLIYATEFDIEKDFNEYHILIYLTKTELIFEPLNFLYIDIYKNDELIIEGFELHTNKDKEKLINEIKKVN